MEPALDRAVVPRDGRSTRLAELRPPACEQRGIDVLRARHRRDGVREPGEVVVGRRDDDAIPVGLEVGRGAESSDEQLADVAQEPDRGIERRCRLRPAEHEEPVAGARGEGGRDATAGGRAEAVVPVAGDEVRCSVGRDPDGERRRVGQLDVDGRSSGGRHRVTVHGETIAGQIRGGEVSPAAVAARVRVVGGVLRRSRAADGVRRASDR